LRIESVQRGASGIAILAAGGFSFSVRPDQLEELGLDPAALVPGSELSVEESALVELADRAKEAESRALALLARAEQSSFMLRSKLEDRGFEKRAIEMALSRLRSSRLLDDARFASAFIRSRLARSGSKPEGPSTLAAALREKGLDRETTAQALAETLGLEQRAEALRAAVEKLRKRDRLDKEGLKRRLRMLGYRSDEISELFELLYP
jgi:regulatory protein